MRGGVRGWVCGGCVGGCVGGAWVGAWAREPGDGAGGGWAEKVGA